MVTSPAASQPLGYETKIVFSSTSDWASVDVTNSEDVICLDIEVLITESDSTIINCHGIFKPDTALVKAEYFLFLTSIPDDGLTFRSQKGDWGNVDIIIVNDNGGLSDTVYVFANHGHIPGDPTNTRSFTVPAELLKENGPAPLEGTALPLEKMVWAFYYPWYGTPQGPTGYWLHWDPNNHYASTDTPLLGYYDSLSDSVVHRQMKWARKHGIEAFISSWWGIHSFEDNALDLILETAREESLKISIYLEASWDAQNASISDRPAVFAHELNYLIDTYGSHPAFSKLNGDPVIFIYAYPLGLIPIEDWATVLEHVTLDAVFIADSFDPRAFEIFDGCHSYNPVALSDEELDLLYWNASVQSYYCGKIFAATVMPGYDDRIIRVPGLFVPRENGVFYQSRWDIATSNSPHWVLITSWNEWHEGTEIEPSIEYGYDYLDATKAHRDEWITVSGDVNGDSIVNILDALMAVNFILELITPTPEEFDRADTNGDGDLNVIDIVMIVKVILGG